jgi:MYXO-CTERM domain-containing protein
MRSRSLISMLRSISLPSSLRRVASLLVPVAVPCLGLALAAMPRAAEAACSNGDPLDCNPAGSTFNVAGRFVDPNPPFMSTQCAGFTNTAADDVAWNWENNCLPFIDQELILRVYDMSGTILASAHLFDPQPCPWGVTVLGYDTGAFEGAGLLGHSGTCDNNASTSFGWHVADTNYCFCEAPDGASRTCDDIYTSNANGSASLYVGGSSTSGPYEAAYGPPGPKGTCTLDAATEVHELQIGIYVANPDGDADGVLNIEDNCPELANAAQDDLDGDDIGDVCDECVDDPNNDVDEDDLCALVDNCPLDSNPLQENADADALGDLCDPCPGDVGNDPDADEICAAMDNCPEAYNPTQIDQDMDGIGAVCDVCPLDPLDDGDGDGLCSSDDNCPDIANVGQEDVDGDDVGDPCDACPDADDMISDSDVDGLCAADDNCPSVANADQADGDRDGDGDACDACPDDAENDIDADDVCASDDNCPELSNPTQDDEDGDGIGDACDDGDDTTGGMDDTTGGVDDTTGPGPGPDTDESGFEPITTGNPGSSDDAGADDSSTGSGGQDTPAAGGCSCTSTPSRGATLSLLALFGLLRRRRPRATPADERRPAR